MNTENIPWGTLVHLLRGPSFLFCLLKVGSSCSLLWIAFTYTQGSAISRRIIRVIKMPTIDALRSHPFSESAQQLLAPREAGHSNFCELQSWWTDPP